MDIKNESGVIERIPSLDRLGCKFTLVSKDEMNRRIHVSFEGALLPDSDFRLKMTLATVKSDHILLNRDVIDEQFLELYAEHEARELWIRRNSHIAEKIEENAKSRGLKLFDEKDYELSDKNRSLYHHISSYFTYLLAQERGLLDEFIEYDSKIRLEEFERIKAEPGGELLGDDIINSYLRSIEIDEAIAEFIKKDGRLHVFS